MNFFMIFQCLPKFTESKKQKRARNFRISFQTTELLIAALDTTCIKYIRKDVFLRFILACHTYKLEITREDYLKYLIALYTYTVYVKPAVYSII